MLKNEWKKLLSNKLMLVVVVAIIAIPTIYTTLFLGSMWDPYGSVENLPVALVNQDQPVDYEGKTLDVGAELVDNLLEDASLDFHPVSADDAAKGLAAGDYYMVITIPQDFSANAATLTDDQPKQMELNYETNPGTNYIASKLSETAMKEIQASVREEVTKTYAETMFDQLTEVGDGMQEAADGAGEIRDGADKLADGNNTIRENLQLLADSTLTFRSGSETLTEGLAQYTQGVQQLADGAKKLDDGAKQLKDGVDQLGASAPVLAQGVGALKDGADQLAQGTAQAKTGSDSLTAGGSTDITGSLTALAGQLDQAAQAAQAGAVAPQDPAALIQTIADNTAAAQTGDPDALNAVLTAASELANVAQSNYNDATTADAARQQAAGALSGAAGALTNAAGGSGSGDLTAALGQLQQGAAQLQTGLSAYTAGVDQAATGCAALADETTGLPALSAGAGELSTGAGDLVNGLAQLQGGTSQLAQQAPLLTGGIAQAASGGAALQQQGTAVLRQGAAQLNSGLDALVAGSGSLKDGMSSLNGQLPALTDGVGRLQQGTKDLKDGTTQLVTGADTLTQNSPALNEGAAALTDGAGQIQSGAQQLADGSGELADGIDQLTDGANTLESSLADGADEIRSTNTGDAVVDMFAAPVVTEETQMTQVPNNGHAMAPYMMSVALWVGCIAFSLMYPLTEYAGKLKSGTAWWLSKASVLYPIAILQALVMVGALHAINGFDPGRMGQTLLVACVASVTFMSVMYFFTNLLGKVGSFLMLVFMVIQLAGSVGTYPLELSGSFVKYLHDWVPFTYTVTAFRRAICAGEDVTGCLAYLAVWLAVFTLLTILVFAVRAKRIKAEKPTLMVWLEEHHLA